MRSSIRYGRNVDILAATRNITREEYWAVESLGTIVLRFSGSLVKLPEDEEFRGILQDFRVVWRLPDIDTDVIYVENPGGLEPKVVKEMANPLINVAAQKHRPKDGVVFVDHSNDPMGIVIAESI